jgi:hypothetical protein
MSVSGKFSQSDDHFVGISCLSKLKANYETEKERNRSYPPVHRDKANSYR